MIAAKAIEPDRSAGDRHPDHTRDHEITDAANVLVVLPQATDGHADLLVRREGGHAQRRFRWSAPNGPYRAETP